MLPFVAPCLPVISLLYRPQVRVPRSLCFSKGLVSGALAHRGSGRPVLHTLAKVGLSLDPTLPSSDSKDSKCTDSRLDTTFGAVYTSTTSIPTLPEGTNTNHAAYLLS